LLPSMSDYPHLGHIGTSGTSMNWKSQDKS
jgi:hypothetical protein